MKCVNCGASYPDLREQCPYCGSENTKRATETHKNTVEWYEMKSTILQRLPGIIGRLAGRFVVKLLIVLIIGGIAVALASAGIAKVKSAIAYESRDSVMDRLEAMYQEEDYEAMMTLLLQQEHYLSATYGRYYRVGDLYKTYKNVAERMEESLQSIAKYGEPEDLQYEVRPLFDILLSCKEYEEAGYVYDEGEAVEAFRRKAENMLREQCYLSVEEIEQGLQLYESEETLIEIYQLIMERYQENHAEE